MVTKIGKIKASCLVESDINKPTVRREIEIQLNTFYSGIDLGKCVQITFPYSYNEGYFHCTEKQAKKLIKLLKKSFK
jgi:hypothetical protein